MTDEPQKYNSVQDMLNDMVVPLSEAINAMVEEAGKYEHCMALIVDQDGLAVELWLDTAVASYSEWVKGEGADIALMRCMDTHRVVGVRLPLMRHKLCVHHKGPLRINEGFKRESAGE